MSTLSQALEHLRGGGMIILTDDQSRENEGDLVAAAEFATPDVINFMATHGRGLICMPVTGPHADRLGLAPMTINNRTRRSTAFTVSIEAAEGITTGISAHERSHTIKVASNSQATAGNIVSPGHIFPLRAAEGGVLVRDGHTEGSIDLMKIAGLNPASVICEIMGTDGTMAKGAELAAFASHHQLPVIAISDIIDHRLRTEALVDELASAELPSSFTGQDLRIHAFRSTIDGQEHLAIVKHPLPAVPLVRIHSECITGEAFGSLRCDCGPQLQESIRRVADSDGGMVIYLRGHEGRGIGLGNKISAYALQDKGMDTVEANLSLGFEPDARNFAFAAQILRAFNITQVDLLSNNPGKQAGLETYGVSVRERQALLIPPNPFNAKYLSTKREKFGHSIFNSWE